MLISQELKKRVESRDAAAMRELAILYLNENNTDKAVLWMEKAAKFGDAEAQYEMAYVCYEKKDFNGSYQWELKSAKQGYPKAQHDLAILYQDGTGTPKNPEKQFYWHLQAAKNGFTDSKYLLADCYLTEVGTPQDLKKAVYWLEQASNEGHAKAKTRLGAAYIEGIGVSVDKEKGLSLLREAIALGDEKAKEFLSEAEKSSSGSGSYNETNEVDKIKEENPTDANAQLLLAMDYDPGLGGSDGKKACYWYTKAAKQGSAFAQNNLACLFFNGNGVPENKTKAKYWYKKAARQGYEKAQRNLDKGGFGDPKGTILSVIGALVLSSITVFFIGDFSPFYYVGLIAGWIIVKEMRKRL